MKIYLFSLLYLFIPVSLILLEKRVGILRKIGIGIVAYGIGILLGSLGLIPKEMSGMHSLFLGLTVPLSIPLLLFSVNIRQWSQLAGKTLIAMVGMFLAVLICTSLAYLFLGKYIPEGWKIAGMAIGVYTGGSANLNAIGLALKASENTLVLTNTADMLACLPWFFFILTLGQRCLSSFLLPFKQPIAKDREVSGHSVETQDMDDFSDIFKRPLLLPLLRILLLDIAICATGLGLYFLVPEDFNMAALMLTVTSLGILASLHPVVHNTKKTFQAGQYFVLVFCVVVGSMADVSVLVNSAWQILMFIAIIVYGSWILHILFCKVFNVDVDTAIITSVAALFSPPFVPVVARELKNRNIILSGLLAGTVGYVVGNYMGIGLAYFLRNLGI